MELLHVAIVTECISPPASVLRLAPAEGGTRKLRRTCNFLREDEEVPSPFYVLADAPFLPLRK